MYANVVFKARLKDLVPLPLRKPYVILLNHISDHVIIFFPLFLIYIYIYIYVYSNILHIYKFLKPNCNLAIMIGQSLITNMIIQITWAEIPFIYY